jgi:hypothetical protein
VVPAGQTYSASAVASPWQKRVQQQSQRDSEGLIGGDTFRAGGKQDRRRSESEAAGGAGHWASANPIRALRFTASCLR